LSTVTETIRFHPFPVQGIDAMTAVSARSYPRHTHDQYGIGTVDAGGHAWWSDRGRFEAGPGQLICLNPGEVHDGWAIGEQPRAWRMLYIEPSVMDSSLADVRDGAHTDFTFGAAAFADPRVRTLLDRAYRYAAGPPGTANAMACDVVLLQLVSRLRAHATTAFRRTTRASACVRRVRARIDANPAAPYTLVELAGAVGLSRYQLIRGFAREVGLTPHAYIVQQRIALARRLIKARNDLADAALASGFFDQSHLTRCFVRQFGVTPGRYAAAVQ
jgi:AraC-like DNA-binding protein